MLNFILPYIFVDVDECSQTEGVCTRENTDCVNTPGGYKCICSEGFEDKDDICVPSIKAGEWSSFQWDLVGRVV